MDTPRQQLDFTSPDDKARGSVSDAKPYLSWVDDARRELEEIRQEAEEAYTLDNEVDRIPESAYDETRFLLKSLFRSDIPRPDIS